MKEILKYTAELGTTGNGFLRLELDDGTIIPSVSFTDHANFAAVCSLLANNTVYYENINGNDKFISGS